MSLRVLPLLPRPQAPWLQDELPLGHYISDDGDAFSWQRFTPYGTTQAIIADNELGYGNPLYEDAWYSTRFTSWGTTPAIIADNELSFFVSIVDEDAWFSTQFSAWGTTAAIIYDDVLPIPTRVDEDGWTYTTPLQGGFTFQFQGYASSDEDQWGAVPPDAGTGEYLIHARRRGRR